VLTKLDVLTGLETIPVCVAYEVDGVRFDEVPVSQSDFHHAKPVYEDLPGWQADTTGCRSWDDLPAHARSYVERLEELAGVPISHVSVGPERTQMIVRST
jgi:adenylosuccinate synthase